MKVSARRAILATLVAGGAAVGFTAPALADSDPAVMPTGLAQYSQYSDDDDDDDRGRVPVGGVETGYGGTAGGVDLLLPLSLLGGGVATAAGIALVGRRLADRAR